MNYVIVANTICRLLMKQEVISKFAKFRCLALNINYRKDVIPYIIWQLYNYSMKFISTK